MLSELDKANLRIKVLEAELAALKSGPADAEVRGPVRYEFRDGVNGFGMYESETGPYVPAKAYDTLLSHIRAAQGQRLTGKRLTVLEEMLDVHERMTGSRTMPDKVRDVFPELLIGPWAKE